VASKTSLKSFTAAICHHRQQSRHRRNPDEERSVSTRRGASLSPRTQARCDTEERRSLATKYGDLLGNIEFHDEAQQVLDKGGEGIGLYRTEFLYLNRPTEPTEQEHYEAYATTVRIMGKRPVVIRTVDLGADKYTQRRRSCPSPTHSRPAPSVTA
jgi:phosphoenolpyruvate-protein kinase (PTS system EI component)